MFAFKRILVMLMACILLAAGACGGLDQEDQAPVAKPKQTQVKQEAKSPAPTGHVAQEANASAPTDPLAPVLDKLLYSKSSVPSRGRGPMIGAAPPPPMPVDREQYQEIKGNPVKRAAEDPVSTFSIDVDTGSYANVRRFLNHGQMPRTDAVRVEELINYFSYNYPVPGDKSAPFKASVAIAPTPWNKDTLLMRIGIKGYEVKADKRPPANLVFLLDVSGSMGSADKLPLLKSAFKMLSQQLRADDKVSIVVYAGAAGVVLEPTPGDQHAKIMAAMDKLRAGGSTAGGRGIQLAYSVARQAFVKDGINRILLATDGDFNVGTTNFRALLDMVEQQRKDGIGLTTLGFGVGNYNEKLMEQLADKGNGNYAYIDRLSEANKVLVEQLSGTLLTIAKDVKLQVEFNPAVVAEYRLIGYENRILAREDFNNDKVDAGEIGAGHTVTALYEVALVGSKGLRMEPLRYQEQKQIKGNADELAFLKIRYKLPDQEKSKLIEMPIDKDLEVESIAKADQDFRWAASVAAFGQILRGGKYIGQFSYDDVLELARTARGDDPYGYRGGFVQMVGLAKALDNKAK